MRDVIQPDRDLGHVDRDHARPGDSEKKKSEGQRQPEEQPKQEERIVAEATRTTVVKCEDCQ